MGECYKKITTGEMDIDWAYRGTMGLIDSVLWGHNLNLRDRSMSALIIILMSNPISCFYFLNHYYCYYHYYLIQWSLYYKANQFVEKFWPYIGMATWEGSCAYHRLILFQCTLSHWLYVRIVCLFVCLFNDTMVSITDIRCHEDRHCRMRR